MQKFKQKNSCFKCFLNPTNFRCCTVCKRKQTILKGDEARDDGEPKQFSILKFSLFYGSAI